MANLDQYGQPLRDPASAILQRKYALAQALQRQGMDTSPVVGTGNNSMQAIARVLQAGLGGYLGSRAEAEAQTMSAAQKDERDRTAAMVQQLTMGAAPVAAPSAAPAASQEAPPMTERLGGAPPVEPPAPVPQVQQQPLPAPTGPSGPPSMYGRNAGAAAQRDAMLDAPPQVLADASSARAAASGLPTNVAYRGATPASEGGDWDRGVPAPTGAVPAFGAGAPRAALAAALASPAAAASPGPDLDSIRQRAGALRALAARGAPGAAEGAAALEAQANRLEARQYRVEDTAESRRLAAAAADERRQGRIADDARADEQLRLSRDAAARATEAQRLAAEKDRRDAERAGLPIGMQRGPDGVAVQIPGVPTAPGAQPTEGERKASGFLQRMEGAEAMMQHLTRPRTGPSPGEGYDPSNLRDRAASYVPLAGNFLTTERGQRYMTAASEWARAKLRHESGAVISDSEAASEARQYFAMPGDSAERIAQKEALRATAVEGLRTAAGRAATAPAASAAPPQGGAHPPLPPGFTVVR